MKLVCTNGPKKGVAWDLSLPRITIGRQSACDIPLDDMKLSRIHAEVVREGDTFVFYDKESLNGSLVNNIRITRHVLVPGDRIRLGDTTFKVSEDELAVDWHKGEPLVTSVIPLDRLTSQVKEMATPLEDLGPVHRDIAGKSRDRIEKLIKNLETVYEVGKIVSSIQTVDQLLNHIARALLDVFPGVQRLCVLFRKDTRKLQVKLTKARSTVARQPFQISSSIINRAVEEEVCILANDASHDERFAASESVMAMHLRSVMCAPMVNKGTVLGVIYLDNRDEPNCFDESDIALLCALSNQAAVAIDNARLYEEIQKSYHEVILALMNTVEAKDAYTRGHSQRTSQYAFGIAQEMGLSEEECEEIKTAAELHDIGKIGVRDLIIGKDAPLSTMEFDSIQQHVIAGENIIKPIEYLSSILPLIRHHHENYDGSGYPDGLRGDNIPLGARIIRIADAFDAMTTQRPYNKPSSFKEAMERCETSKGKDFDPRAVDALIRFLSKQDSEIGKGSFQVE